MMTLCSVLGGAASTGGAIGQAAALQVNQMNWFIKLYLAHPIAVPVVGGLLIATVFFLLRGALWKLAKLPIALGVAGAKLVAWPVRKLYAYAFSSKNQDRVRLPLNGEKAFFGPDPITGMKDRRVVVVTASYGGFYRGVDPHTGKQYICSPDKVSAL